MDKHINKKAVLVVMLLSAFISSSNHSVLRAFLSSLGPVEQGPDTA